MFNYFDRLTVIKLKKVIHDQSYQVGMRKVTHTVYMTAIKTGRWPWVPSGRIAIIRRNVAFHTTLGRALRELSADPP